MPAESIRLLEPERNNAFAKGYSQYASYSKLFLVLIALHAAWPAIAQDKPNILIIWGDDIGQYNISAYNMGVMGYKTPHIDRIAREGMIFTDAYGENSCTAGRSTFITGQSGFRTGLLKVGLPGADLGLQAEDATIAEVYPAQAARLRNRTVREDTILAIWTSTCRPTMASTSSLGTSIT